MNKFLEGNSQSLLKRKEQLPDREKPFFQSHIDHTHTHTHTHRINEFHRVEFLQTILYNHNAKLKSSNKIKNHKTLSMINF